MSIKQAIEALELALPIMEEQATIQGYGFYRPANPNDFSPDPESCTEEEIANHRAACKAYDEGKFVPDTSDGWVSPNLHILKAPWGIGSYTETIPELQAQCDKTRAALAALRSMPAEPVAWQARCFYPEQGDTEWGSWTAIATDNLDVWRRLVKEMPDKYELRPLSVTPHTAPLSDAEILALWSGSDTALRPVLGGRKVITFARAIEQAIGRASRVAK